MNSGASGSTADSVPRLSFPLDRMYHLSPALLSLTSLMGMVTEAPQLEQAWPCKPFMLTKLSNTLSPTYPHSPNLSILNLITLTLTRTPTTIGKTTWTQLHLLGTLRIPTRTSRRLFKN